MKQDIKVENNNSFKNSDSLISAIIKLISNLIKRISEFLNFILLSMIKFYRKFISPMKKHSSCIYTPTCSQYAIEALEKYGPIKGTFLTIKRILRCNPLSKGGYDPVP